MTGLVLGKIFTVIDTFNAFNALTVFITLAAVIIAGCTEISDSGFIGHNSTGWEENLDNDRVFIDDFGYVTEINTTPQRIISLAPSNTELLYAIGLGDKIVAVTDYCDYPPDTSRKEKVGGYSTVNVEKVISLNPDLVVAAYGNGKNTVEFLRDYVPVVSLNPSDFDEIERDIFLLGKITGEEENASKLVQFMRERMEKIRCRNNVSMLANEDFKNINNAKKVKVAHIIWHDPIWVSGRETFIDEMITEAGGENIFNFTGWRIVSEEDLFIKEPDIIIVNGGTGMAFGRNTTYEGVMKMDLDAVKAGRVYIIDPDIVSRPSYRLIYGLEKICEYIQLYKAEKGHIEIRN